MGSGGLFGGLFGGGNKSKPNFSIIREIAPGPEDTAVAMPKRRQGLLGSTILTRGLNLGGSSRNKL